MYNSELEAFKLFISQQQIVERKENINQILYIYVYFKQNIDYLNYSNWRRVPHKVQVQPRSYSRK